QAAQLIEILRLGAPAVVALHHRPDEAAVCLQGPGRRLPVPPAGQLQEVQGVGGHYLPAGRGRILRRMVTRVPLPSAERTVSLSIKLSMMVKPMPLRSSPPVV